MSLFLLKDTSFGHHSLGLVEWKLILVLVTTHLKEINVGPQVLPTLLKAITVKKYAYHNLIMYSPKCLREVDRLGQPSNLPIISSPPPMTLLGFEPLTSFLIPLVGPQMLPTLLKIIIIRKDAYPNLIVHSSKRPWRTQRKLMDVVNPSICQQPCSTISN